MITQRSLFCPCGAVKVTGADLCRLCQVRLRYSKRRFGGHRPRMRIRGGSMYITAALVSTLSNGWSLFAPPATPASTGSWPFAITFRRRWSLSGWNSIRTFRCSYSWNWRQVSDSAVLAIAHPKDGLARLRGLVLDSVLSPHSRRAYAKALDDFLSWYLQFPRGPLSKALVQASRSELDRLGLASSTINVPPGGGPETGGRSG
jgi:hypothetical protein